MSGSKSYTGNEAIAKAAELEQLEVDSENWVVMYRDPKDGSLWKKTYPNSSYHSGGVPHLDRID